MDMTNSEESDNDERRMDLYSVVPSSICFQAIRLKQQLSISCHYAFHLIICMSNFKWIIFFFVKFEEMVLSSSLQAEKFSWESVIIFHMNTNMLYVAVTERVGGHVQIVISKILYLDKEE